MKDSTKISCLQILQIVSIAAIGLGALSVLGYDKAVNPDAPANIPLWVLQLQMGLIFGGAALTWVFSTFRLKIEEK